MTQKSYPNVVTDERKTSQLYWTCRLAISRALLLTTAQDTSLKGVRKPTINSSGISCHEENGFFYLRKISLKDTSV